MASSIGRVLVGRKATYELLEVLKAPAVFKARILPSSQCVVVKDVLQERELAAHQLPEIRACPHIRQLRDVIEPEMNEHWPPSEPKKMVLEWMDTDLWHCRPHGKLANPKLPQIIAKSVLEALVVFQNLHAVHTDINPNNVFASCVDQPVPIVKLGDLNNAFREGVAKGNPNAQTNETRAPEVWKGLGVYHPSDIWSLGVTLVHWLMSRTLFGPRDKIIEQHTTAWCLAKIIRLIGPLDIPQDPKYKYDFELANDLAESTYEDPETGQPKPYIVLGSLRQEVERLPRDVCSYGCIDFLEYLLVIDPAQRPTAEQALQHPFVRF